MRSERVEFPGSQGFALAGRLDQPDDSPRACALFAHCFTCSKDIAAASRIAKGLVEQGLAVLRFDFTGLGHSDGEFSNTNFSSNVEDLVRASDWLRAREQAPALLLGHSLGGAAVLSAAVDVPEVRAVVTIGAPADPAHVTNLFSADIATIEQDSEAEVDLAGRKFKIKKQFLDDIAEHRLSQRIRRMRCALLILHSPIDEIVGIDNAATIYGAARHPKSFVALDGADHLLRRPEDAEYAAAIVACWVRPYLRRPARTDAR
jgi:putative redox protein